MPYVGILHDSRVNKGRNAPSDGKFPIKLQVYLAPKDQFLVSTKLLITAAEYKKVNNSKCREPEIRKLKLDIEEQRLKGEQILAGMSTVTAADFRLLFNQDKVKTVKKTARLKDLFDAKIAEIDVYNTKRTYKESFSSFGRFAKDHFRINEENLTIGHFNLQAIKAYAAWNAKKGNAFATTQIHCRNLKCIFNIAVDDKLIKEDMKPFGKRKFVIGSSASAKKNLTEQELYDFWNYSGETGAIAKDFWWFTYMANGINPCDALSLKEEHIQGNCIYFKRRKTNKRNKTGKLIVVPITSQLRDIIERRKANGYLFGSNYSVDMTPEEQGDYIRTFRKSKNDSLRKVSKLLTLRFPINLSMARPSFATSMKLGEVPNTIIADQLGHTNTKTTDGYQGSIPIQQSIDNAVHLFAFLKQGKPSNIHELLKQRNITLSPLQWIKAVTNKSVVPEGNVYVHAKIDNKVWINRDLVVLPKVKEDGSMYYGIGEQEYCKPEEIHVFIYAASEGGFV